jgi:protease-4
MEHAITMSRRSVAAKRNRAAGLAAATLLIGLAGCAPTSFLVTPVTTKRDLVEHVVIRESVWATSKIALVDIDGVIQNTRSTSLLGTAGENPVSLFAEKLDKAARDDDVRAIVVRINSPGGTVTASDLMYQELRRFRQRTGRPIIAAMLDIAASGGYYIACAADRIYAQPTTVTGSIGVILLAPEFSGTMQKLGVTMNVIKSGEMKDSGSPFRTMSEDDRAMLQGLIDGMYARFLGVVGEARRNVSSDRLRELADGRVFLGPVAKAHGLVDEVGTLREAIDAAKRAAALEDTSVKVVEYSRPHGHRPNIYAQPTGPGQINLLNVQVPDWFASPAPKLLYLWAPGW